MASLLDKFNAVFDDICKEVLDDLRSPQYALPSHACDWIERALKYTVPGGKMNRGLSVVESYRSLVNERELTSVEERQCFLLGWCVEMLQAFFLVADDIMDQSKTRRNQKCYYLLEDTGNIAINDCLIIESLIYGIFKKHFRQQPYYLDLIELMHDITYKTELGQLLDLITAPEGHVDLDRFSLEKHAWIVKYKTAYYSFYLPVAMAMLMAGYNDESLLKQTETILMDMGEYFQIQDDYLDCFGDAEVIGKIGTDILDNKCSWLINMALKKCTPQQRQLLNENYGRKDSKCEAVVKRIFNELDLKGEFLQYEEKSFQRINEMISQIDSKRLPHSIFTKFMKKIYKRTK